MNELLILVGGMVELLRPGSDAAEELLIDEDGHSSLRGTCIRRGAAPLALLPHAQASDVARHEYGEL